MACPFLGEKPVAEGARVIRRAFRIRPNHVLRDRQDPLAHLNNVLIERYRFSREGVIYIINLLEPQVKCSTRRSRALTTAQTVCISLRFFVSGTFLYTIGDAENFVKSAMYIIIVNEDHATMIMPKSRTYSISSSGFPNIDCTHVPIKAPPGPSEGDFVNRKGFHSVNVQVLTTGSCLVAGAMQYFMTPFPDPNPRPQTRFNAALARTRARIEITFGQLKEKFQCLKGLRVAPDKACDIIVACAVLHNIRKERTPLVEVQPDDDLQPVHLDHPSGRAARDRIVEHHF
ncbi:putative nuclease HARBI1 [Anabarilius grahami]|uniref:Putative nuclease HARBI1 n=1 Tax=Anabarilius grahami TaxID=495550 RepID=A0A3N0YP51_ANAGA|nr:putative nuclease HARBI1 [Anabarilius grahami]